MPVLPANMTCPLKEPTETKQKVVKKAAQDAKVEKSGKKPKPPAKVKGKGKGKKLLPPIVMRRYS
jgi:hypothetical protein